ncbi:GGDEF domain-containing protein [Gilvimarinus sp. SDUM040013]|uniref:diguanylate cyclase n=1 Tax=Gilvimarinus gilvus TaxID=3058038 RepID=A0ABU4RUV9_9GAMM|nr:GGDEF domain-containing protein [Gilvimarinus sp. SDUM040013]MDO3388468.1 GGDEF domain-containing protein [Gilvimarinus sp. SDUM040013]MDX6848660.1 GGDEF domain-containing protein [Gilvimarinus sp. SDUM040013]
MIKTLRDNFRQAMALLLSGCAIAAIAPLALMRALSGEWLLAGLDFVIVLGMLLIFRHTLRHRRSSVANLLSSAFYSLAATGMVHLLPETMIYWMFPVVIANFFLLKLTQAIGINIVLFIAIGPAVPALVNPLEAVDMYVALALVCAFAGIFSWKTEDQRLQLEALAHLDPLTGIGNRRKLFSALGENRREYSGSVVLIDLDRFKAINDELGHEKGDDVLQQLTRLIQKLLRSSDEIYRYGGEEFLVVLNNTNLENACKVAELLRIEVAQHLPVTASFGCAQKQETESWDSWINRADKALYRAKNEGRNCVRPAPTSFQSETADALQ